MAFYSCCLTLGETMFPVNFPVVFIGVCPSSPINRKSWLLKELTFFFSVPANSPILDFFDSFSEMDMDAMHLPVYFQSWKCLDLATNYTTKKNLDYIYWLCKFRQKTEDFRGMWELSTSSSLLKVMTLDQKGRYGKWVLLLRWYQRIGCSSLDNHLRSQNDELLAREGEISHRQGRNDFAGDSLTWWIWT